MDFKLTISITEKVNFTKASKKIRLYTVILCVIHGEGGFRWGCSLVCPFLMRGRVTRFANMLTHGENLFFFFTSKVGLTLLPVSWDM